MPSTTHLVLGPPGAGRTARLLAAYRAAPGLGAALYLVPTRRQAGQVRDRLAAGSPAAVAPHVLDLQAFADELVRQNDPAVRPLSDIDRRLLVDAVLAELVADDELPYFAGVAETRGFADAAAGYVAELKDAAADLRPLLRASPGRQPGGGELSRHAQAVKVFDRYQRRLARLHRLDPGDRLGRAADHWAAGRRGSFAGVRVVVLDGFTALTPYTRRLLDALRDTADAVWAGLPEGDGEAFAGPRAVREWAAQPVGEPSLFNPAPEVVTERLESEPGWPAGLFAEIPGRPEETPPPDPLPRGERGDRTTDPPSSSPSSLRGGGRGVGSVPPSPRGGGGLGGWGPALHLIEAPGELGEARLVARHVRRLLAAGTPPDHILVVARRLDPPTVELVREVFDEYAVPHEAEGADPLARVPAVAFLLKAWRLAADDWPFPRVAAVLRSGYFRPDWPEVKADPEIAAKAEALLRLVGETRGKDAYLAAVRAWEHTPPEALEDEQAEESRRQRTQRLAARCRPFLERFFRAWDRLKPAAPAEGLVAGLKAFADDIGLSRAADAADVAGLGRLWAELGRWAKAEASTSRKPVRAERFARVLSAVAAVPCRGRSLRDTGRVRLLSAGTARGLDCDHLILIGLGEGSWPQTAGPVSLLDDAERERLRKAGVGLPDPAGRLAAEQLLFLELVSAPRRGLVLSYPAVDDRGQPRLPASFLRDVLALFPPGSIPTTRRRMLVEGYFTDEPLSGAEARVQWAASQEDPTPLTPLPRGGRGEQNQIEGGRLGASSPSPLRGGEAKGRGADRAEGSLPPDLLDHLDRARQVADARFRQHSFTRYDGELRHPAVAAELARRFGPDRVFSPTSLETYVACPFRFWLEHVLRLDPLDDPAEEVEHTRRGAAFHRALARLHRWVKEMPSAPDGDVPEAVTHDLIRRIEEAVEEYARRAPSVAGRELWRLEGERLKRAAAKYRGHWQEFRKPWREKGAAPVPHAFEADFGVPGEGVPEALTLTVGDVVVKVGGRIDRVDVADAGGGSLGFWVIDYKTGRAENYSASQVERFEKLQLPLYAVAVERVLLKDRPARPLGLAYWLVTDTGPKPMLPSRKNAVLSWLSDPGRWERFREQLEAWVATLAGRIRAGDFPLAPRSEHCTETCRFGPVCRIGQSRSVGKVNTLALPVLPREKDPGDR
ncbi:MAG: exodeoxyribonuclease V subunit gamma [Gemmataceae bacterium]|nr:exodeoxyribonuclease V subunit gamma [Gemmataceae bacterium]